MCARKLNDAEIAAGERLRIAVLHADKPAANRVKEISSRVLQNFHPGCPVSIHWWSVESLNDKELFETSRQAAAEADLLFLALNTSVELSPEVKNWLPAALAGNGSGRRRALIVLLDTRDVPRAWHSQVERYLRNQASSAGIDYFMYLDRRSPSARGLTDVEERGLP